ncbi:hypothetical protein [Streptomyces sp. NPDC002785]|uniref:hypothetical protein n=1 Tax=Streptomyces sp. NPDC002785 TaxID=3154543 RepID=UPI00332DAD15
MCLLAQSLVGRDHPRFQARGRQPEILFGRSRQAAVVFGEGGGAEGDKSLQRGDQRPGRIADAVAARAARVNGRRSSRPCAAPRGSTRLPGPGPQAFAVSW